MTPEQILSLVTSPRETLETEYKPWIDMDIPEGQAVLVLACLALRNYGGGCLVIGFRDRAGQLQALPAPPYAIREKFSGDAVARLVGKYSLSPFETVVHLVPHDRVEHPVIEVAADIRVPAVTKESIEKAPAATLLKKDAVYTRTLDSNNTPSSAIASKDDWEKIMRICGENRETDIGSFMRRHLTSEHLAQLRSLFMNPQPGLVLSGDAISRSLLDSGAHAFETTAEQITMPDHGAFEVGLFFSVPNDKFKEGPSKQFLNLLTSVNPNYWNGWPLWLNATSVVHQEVKPKPVGDQWMAALILLDPAKWTSQSIDFWTASSRGFFYHRRGFWEDHLSPPGILRYPSEPMTLLDAVLQVTFVAEALIVGQAFARAMGCSDTEKLDFSFRWTQLHARTLGSPIKPSRLFLEQHRSTDNQAPGGCFLPLDTAPSAVFQYVQQATKTLFHRFDGFELPANWLQRTVDDFLARRSF
jgi:hypothetical protein